MGLLVSDSRQPRGGKVVNKTTVSSAAASLSQGGDRITDHCA